MLLKDEIYFSLSKTCLLVQLFSPNNLHFLLYYLTCLLPSTRDEGDMFTDIDQDIEDTNNSICDQSTSSDVTKSQFSFVFNIIIIIVVISLVIALVNTFFLHKIKTTT